MDDNAIQAALSIGISIFPKDGTDPNILIQRADGAMYQAKKSGKNNLQFFGPQ
jgi:diguanylate cyclase (GGDEF)-like protein